MKISVKNITNEKTWEQFILSRSEANFLQSFNWGKFHQKLGKKIFRIALIKDNQIIAAAQAIKETARRATYLAIPAGPLIDWPNHSALKFLINHLKKIAQQQSCSFIRIRPQILDSPPNRQSLIKHGFIKSPMHLTADLTLRLNLNQTQEKLLSQMRKSTRYDIRRAQKLKITVNQSTNPKDIKAFYQHQVKLAQNHHFVPFSYNFLYHQFQVFAANNQAALFHAFLNQKLLASAFIIFYHQEAVYHYGISTPKNHKLPGTHACLWEAINSAKKRGFNYFNFWGIAPQNQPHHRFAGVSNFKRGFGGQETAYLPAHDLPLNIKYYPNYCFETIRKKLRHL